MRRFSLIIAMLATAISFAGCAAGRAVSYSGIVISDRDTVTEAIRRGYRHRAEDITLSFEAATNVEDSIPAITDELVNDAMEETDSPEEGDYLSYQNGGYTLSYQVRENDGGYAYTLRIHPDYYTYLYQEEYVTESVEEIADRLGLKSPDISDEKKAKLIYDYIYENVVYDTVHKNKSNNHMKNTAYSALYYRTAGCQGYAVLFYRLAKEAGLSVRVVTGDLVTAGEAERHAWNIVCVDEKWYHADVTADKVRNEHQRFLCGADSFSDHVMDDEFLSYPIAKEDFAY